MIQKKTIEELGDEYEQNSIELEKIVEKAKKELRSSNPLSTKTILLRKKITMYEDMAFEQRMIARNLKNYYE